MKLKANVVPRTITPFFLEMERFTVGVAQLGYHKGNRYKDSSYRLRRLVAHRSKLGITSYYLYSEPNRGKQVFNVLFYIPIKEVTKERFIKIRYNQ